MGENTEISWTDHTFNPWIGCAKVSPGCANCYAETLMDLRYGKVKWGKGQPRQRTSAANWKLPLRWDRDAITRSKCSNCGEECHSQIDRICLTCGIAALQQIRPRVFCASLSDWLDDEVPIEWLADFLELVHKCQNLDFLLLTKRPQNWLVRLEAVELTGLAKHEITTRWINGSAPANVWIGTTIEDQKRADERIPHLLRIPARVRFLSCEPLLGPVDLRIAKDPDGILRKNFIPGIHWVIAGGESGHGARPMHPEWARSLRDQCQAAGVPFHFKQWGEWIPGGIYGDMVVPDCLGANIDDPSRSHYFEEPPFLGRTWRVGKKAAGRLLDGTLWDEFPTVR